MAIQHTPTAKVLADSIHQGQRLITLECTFWRSILPEVNTHRVFSRNSRSSRAVPVKKLIEEVRTSPWGPGHWGKNQPGMQAQTEFTDTLRLEQEWQKAAKSAANIAELFSEMGVHKQIVNRILEPYVCTHAVISSTEWDNFFKLRISEQAQPEMRDLAIAMKDAIDNSTPTELSTVQWHLPYISESDRQNYDIDNLLLMSAARCARVSYKTFDGSTSPEKDIELAKRLMSNGHWSPFEHQATPRPYNSTFKCNFVGWDQQRQFREANCNVNLKMAYM